MAARDEKSDEHGQVRNRANRRAEPTPTGGSPSPTRRWLAPPEIGMDDAGGHRPPASRPSGVVGMGDLREYSFGDWLRLFLKAVPALLLAVVALVLPLALLVALVRWLVPL